MSGSIRSFVLVAVLRWLEERALPARPKPVPYAPGCLSDLRELEADLEQCREARSCAPAPAPALAACAPEPWIWAERIASGCSAL